MSTLKHQEQKVPAEAIIEEQIVESQPAHAEGPDINLLQDKVPVEFQARRALVIWIFILGSIYLYLSYQTVYYTDIWGHLAYGRQMLETKSVPVTETLMPLSKGIPFVDSAWLSQLTAAALYAKFGISSLQFLYAAPLVISFAIFCWMLYRQTKSHLLTLLGLGGMILVCNLYFFAVRPQLGGFVCYLALMAATLRPWRKHNWVSIPVIFLFWGNLHGSWPVGLALLGCLLLGRIIDKAFRAESILAVFQDHLVKRYFLLLELSVIALLINPYGLKALVEVLLFPSHPNLSEITEWGPLSLNIYSAQMALIVGVPLLILYRWTPRRVTTGEVLLLLVLGYASLASSRMLIWWGPIAAWFLVKHLYALWKRQYPGIKEYWVDSPRKGLYSVVAVGMVWIFFAYTPFGTTLLHGQPKNPETRESIFVKRVANGTPVYPTKFLLEHPPVGQIFNTYETGDYLLYNGPKDMKVFVASHAHLIPVDVWNDYLFIISQRTGWEDKLDRYGVNTILLDKTLRSGLINRLNDDAQWERVYSDVNFAIFFRKQPIINQP